MEKSIIFVWIPWMALNLDHRDTAAAARGGSMAWLTYCLHACTACTELLHGKTCA